MPTHQFPPAIEKKYKFLRELGAGAYGIVCALRNLETGEEVACKKLIKVFDKPILARRALREIKLLRHLNGHENITNLIDIELPDPNNFNEVFLIEGLMEADLHQIIRSGQPLTDAHYQYFLYQICRGMKYIHSANILHRDLKPGNLLVNADCELRVCDFGLARGFSQTVESNAGFMTEYVTTRWYRAPEIMLSFQCYTKAIDVWSVGCIFAELLGGKPLFKGQTYVDQLNQIMGILGTPDDSLLRRIGSEKALSYIRSLPRMAKVPFSKLYPKATPAALDLLEKMLKWDPLERITIDKALEHPYLSAYHDKEDEPKCPTDFDFGFESVKTVDDIKKMIVAEVADFKRFLAAKNEKKDRGPLSARLPHPQGYMPTAEEKINIVRDDNDEELGGGIEDELRSMQLDKSKNGAKAPVPPAKDSRESSRLHAH